VLRALQSQDWAVAEVVVVDNESTDRSRDVAKEYGAKIVSLSRNDFTYGRALNIGIKETSQPFILNLSAHSVPLGRTFINEALGPFSNPAVGAVSCRNVSRNQDLADWPIQSRLSGNVDWETLCNRGLINSGAVIRRDIWSKIPFDESLPFWEDALWSQKVLTAGYDIVTSAAMYAYLRDHTFAERLRRRDSERMASFQISGLRPNYDPRRIAKAVLVGGPRAALRLIAYECLLCASALTVPFRSSSSLWTGLRTSLGPPREIGQKTQVPNPDQLLRPGSKKLAF
jgi:glycosyltransferase involved in cell wall biosynthesis